VAVVVYRLFETTSMAGPKRTKFRKNETESLRRKISRVRRAFSKTSPPNDSVTYVPGANLTDTVPRYCIRVKNFDRPLYVRTYTRGPSISTTLRCSGVLIRGGDKPPLRKFLGKINFLRDVYF